MITDRIQNARAYQGLGKGIAAALNYLAGTDFTNLANGRYDIDGQRVYALVNRYRTKSQSQIVWESHRKYLDVQFLAKGVERLGYLNLASNPKVTKPYDSENDAALYEGHGTLLELGAEDFVIFSPQDVHAPGLAGGTPPIPSDVVKVVVKVAVNEASGPCGY